MSCSHVGHADWLIFSITLTLHSSGDLHKFKVYTIK